MIYGLTKGTDFEKICDGAAKAEAEALKAEAEALKAAAAEAESIEAASAEAGKETI